MNTRGITNTTHGIHYFWKIFGGSALTLISVVSLYAFRHKLRLKSERVKHSAGAAMGKSQHHRSRYDEDEAKAEIQSVIAEDIDIEPLSFSSRTTQRIFGERLIANFLAENELLNPLLHSSLKQMGTSWFRDNYKNLLRPYIRALLQRAMLNGEDTTAGLLRARGSTHRLSLEVVRILFAENDSDIEGEDQRDRRSLAKDLNEVSFWEDHSDIGEEYEREKEREGNLITFSHTSEVAPVVDNGRALQVLFARLESLYLPMSLQRVIESVPKERIWFSSEDDLSLLNRMKSFVEDSSGVEWNWWPLRPRMRYLQAGQTRLNWHCVCLPYILKSEHANIS
jgi:hypothetical protein